VGHWCDDFDSDSKDEDDDNHDHMPDEYRRKIYDQATPFVNKFLADHNDARSEAEIKKLNKRIRKRNKEEGVKDERAFYININVLKSIGMEGKFFVSRLESNPDDEVTFEKLVSLDKQLETTCRVNHYPQDWTFVTRPDLRGKIEQRRESQQNEMMNNQTSRQQQNVPADGSIKSGRGRGTTAPASGSSDGVASGTVPHMEPKSHRKGKEEKSSSSNLGKDIAGKSSWAAGETKDGQRILGYRPFYQTNRRTGEATLHGVQFVVETQDQTNSIALLSGTEVGHSVTDAYLGLPDSAKNDVRFSDKRYSLRDASDFEELLGFATKALGHTTISEPTTRYPGYGLVLFKTGKRDILSRTAMRNMLGKKDADDEIKAFFPGKSQSVESRATQPPSTGTRPYDTTEASHAVIGRGGLTANNHPDSLLTPEDKSANKGRSGGMKTDINPLGGKPRALLQETAVMDDHQASLEMMMAQLRESQRQMERLQREMSMHATRVPVAV
jgi:hypothetical protein